MGFFQSNQRNNQSIDCSNLTNNTGAFKFKSATNTLTMLEQNAETLSQPNRKGRIINIENIKKGRNAIAALEKFRRRSERCQEIAHKKKKQHKENKNKKNKQHKENKNK